MKLLHRICIQDSRNLNNIEDHSCQSLVTSPPYNMKGFQRNTGGKPRRPAYRGYSDNMDEGDYRRMVGHVLACCMEKMKPNGAIFWNMKSRTINKECVPPFWFLDYASKQGLTLINIIIWAFPSGADTTYKKFWGRYEYLFYFKMDKDNYIFNPEGIRVPTKYNQDRRYNPRGKNPADVWLLDYDKDKEDTFEYTSDGLIWYITHNINYGEKHPATFPAELARRCILATTNEGDVVLDPFLGSGTTCVEAKRNNRGSVGIEIAVENLPVILENMGYYQKDMGRFEGVQHTITIEPKGILKQIRTGGTK